MPHRFLVTGGAGFIGSHTVTCLLNLGHQVRVLDNLSTGKRENLAGLDVDLHVGSIEDATDVARAMVGVDRVIHLAARISVPDSMAHPVAYDTTNVGGFLKVLDAGRAAGVTRIVYASSCAVYGSLEGLPKRVGDAVEPESPYAANKYINEVYGALWGRAMGCSAIGLRYFNVFGPGQDPSGPYGAVIPKFVERALGGHPLLIFGDGEQARDFVSVYDVARANVAASLVEGHAHPVYNVGSGQMTSITQLGAMVRRLIADVGVEYRAERPGDVRLSQACIEATHRDLAWAPERALEEALEETVTWFKARYSADV